jgi:hypothetical protein
MAGENLEPRSQELEQDCEEGGRRENEERIE